MHHKKSFTHPCNGKRFVKQDFEQHAHAFGKHGATLEFRQPSHQGQHDEVQTEHGGQDKHSIDVRDHHDLVQTQQLDPTFKQFAGWQKHERRTIGMKKNAQTKPKGKTRVRPTVGQTQILCVFLTDKQGQKMSSLTRSNGVTTRMVRRVQAAFCHPGQCLFA